MLIGDFPVGSVQVYLYSNGVVYIRVLKGFWAGNLALGETAERWAWHKGLRAQLEDSITRGNNKLHIEDKLTGEVDIRDFYLLFNFNLK